MFKTLVMAGLTTFASVCAWGIEDPTRPPADVIVPSEGAVEQRMPVLSSIVYSDQRRLAVINGQVFLEGQRRGGLALVEVMADNVLVQVGSEEQVTLHLGSGQINKELK
ncbi:MAG: general secretion pathway protein GspB [Pseudomonadaceae bacterium]|nr:general secretion pathway protein GspB [Pseudomonadaceae bacterium]